MTAARQACSPGTDSCAALGNLTAIDAAPPEDWEPYRCCVDYSMDIFNPTGLADIVVLSSMSDLEVDFFSAFFTMVTSPFFMNFTSFAFIWAAIFAHAVWFAERSCNPEQFPHAYLDGIDDAMWWAIVTFTTVGYGAARCVLLQLRLLLLLLLSLRLTVANAAKTAALDDSVTKAVAVATDAHQFAGLQKISLGL